MNNTVLVLKSITYCQQEEGQKEDTGSLGSFSEESEEGLSVPFNPPEISYNLQTAFINTILIF